MNALDHFEGEIAGLLKRARPGERLRKHRRRNQGRQKSKHAVTA
jgi:hypothetical protein